MGAYAELFHRVVGIDERPEVFAEARAFALRELAMRDGPVPERARVRDALAALRAEAPRGRDALIAYAPNGLLEGCWLARASNAATHHSEIGTRMLQLYAHAIGDGDPAAHHGNLFRAIAAAEGVTLPPVTSRGFLGLAIPEASYRLALVTLCAGLFPRDFTPELVGCSLYRFAGPQLARAIELIELVGEWPRIWNAVRVLAELDQAWRAELAARHVHTPHEQMIALVRAKAPIGHGYHKAHALGDATLDAHLDPATLDPEQFLAALARSPYVVPGDPAASRLVRATDFGHPMFRVFSPAELDTIRAWIASLPDAVRGADSRTVLSPDGRVSVVRGSDSRTSPDHRVSVVRDPDSRTPAVLSPDSLVVRRPRVRRTRTVFATLVDADRDDAAAGLAHRHAERAFARARRWRPWWPGRYQRYFAYSREAFDAWCDGRHRAQVARYRPPAAHPLLSREQCVWLLSQLAPIVLVDGCWLQHVTATQVTEVTGTLFRIYYDEVGNGDTALNHANVYREMLAGAGIAVPDAAGLADWPVLVDAAFELPALWLAVSHATRRFFPELLGMNLGIEFAGIGGGYMGFADLLRQHGIEPTLIELHNSIDNLSSGHTAWARDAVHAHLERVRDEAGDAAMQASWRRIWTGTRAHDRHFGAFERACALRLAPRVAGSVIRRKLARRSA